jgi:hypothetical protein
MAKERGPQAPGPVVNVVLPENFGLYPPPTGRTSGPSTTPPMQLHESTNLIPSNYTEGEKMNLETFCLIYALPEDIKQRLHQHKITGTHAFAHMTIKHLEGMGFMLGEIIDLKEAIKCWAQGCD